MRATSIRGVALGVALGAALTLSACRSALPPPAGASADVRAVLRSVGPSAEARLRPFLRRAGVRFPPDRIWLIVLKAEREMELWASSGDGRRFVRDYPVLAASGGPGPKLAEGDLQVPEGIYRVLWLQPKSSEHLSMKLDYPNEFDREMARRDGRGNLGGDIFIHGRAESIGCVAIGDPAIEELFDLVARTGVSAVIVVIAPWDLRVKATPTYVSVPWAEELYARLRVELDGFRRREAPPLAPSHRRKPPRR
jgi:L,D-transpeptidase catalytic domain